MAHLDAARSSKAIRSRASSSRRHRAGAWFWRRWSSTRPEAPASLRPPGRTASTRTPSTSQYRGRGCRPGSRAPDTPTRTSRSSTTSMQSMLGGRSSPPARNSTMRMTWHRSLTAVRGGKSSAISSSRLRMPIWAGPSPTPSSGPTAISTRTASPFIRCSCSSRRTTRRCPAMSPTAVCCPRGWKASS